MKVSLYFKGLLFGIYEDARKLFNNYYNGHDDKYTQEEIEDIKEIIKDLEECLKHLKEEVEFYE